MTDLPDPLEPVMNTMSPCDILRFVQRCVRLGFDRSVVVTPNIRITCAAFCDIFGLCGKRIEMLNVFCMVFPF